MVAVLACTDDYTTLYYIDRSTCSSKQCITYHNSIVLSNLTIKCVIWVKAEGWAIVIVAILRMT